jgi:hypothetical protein
VLGRDFYFPASGGCEICRKGLGLKFTHFRRTPFPSPRHIHEEFTAGKEPVGMSLNKWRKLSLPIG